MYKHYQHWNELAPRGLLLSVLTFVLAFGVVGYAAMGNRDGWSVGPGENVAATPDAASDLGAPTPDAAPTFHFFASSAEWQQPPAVGTAALVLGAARVRPTVLAENQPIAARLSATLTLAYDARIVDQAYADAFLGAVMAQLARAA